MANNKVQLANGTILVDLTDTTATATDVAQGKYFYGANGVKTVGTASFDGGIYQDENGFLVLDPEGDGGGDSYSTYYTGTTTPLSSFGEDGDVYLQT